MVLDDAGQRRLAEALRRTAARDPRAFRVVYEMMAPKLFGICLRICGERKAAEDVLQEVFVTVWARADRFDPARGGAVAWLSTMARNRSIDWRRTNYRPTAPTTELDSLPDPSPLASDTLLLDEKERRLHYCLDGLEPNQRNAIRTAFFEGTTYAELAERLSVPLGTMKSWVRRGLLRLRECLDGDDR